jgi:hypothetical protein
MLLEVIWRWMAPDVEMTALLLSTPDPGTSLLLR